MRCVPESGLPSTIAEAVENFERLAVHDIDFHVLAVDDVHILLIFIARKRDIPHRTLRARLRRNLLLGYVLAVALENLQTIGAAIADIQQPIVARLRAMYWTDELLGQRFAGRVANTTVFRFVAVSAPDFLKFAARIAEQCDTVITVTVRDIYVVQFFINRNLRDFAEVRRAVAICLLTGLTDLLDEFAVVCEHKNVRIVGLGRRVIRAAAGCATVAADPNVAFAVDLESVIRRGPRVAFSWSAPCLNHVAFGIEFDN